VVGNVPLTDLPYAQPLTACENGDALAHESTATARVSERHSCSGGRPLHQPILASSFGKTCHQTKDQHMRHPSHGATRVAHRSRACGIAARPGGAKQSIHPGDEAGRRRPPTIRRDSLSR
jgi:hypothetical protein